MDFSSDLEELPSAFGLEQIADITRKSCGIEEEEEEDGRKKEVSQTGSKIFNSLFHSKGGALN